MKESLLNYGVVINFFVAIDVIDNTSQVSSPKPFRIQSPFQTFKETLRNGHISSTNCFFFNTNILISYMPVAANHGKTFRQHDYGITFYNKSSCLFVCHFVKIVCIIFVCNSRSSIVQNLDLLENVCIYDVNVRNHSQSSSQTDSCEINSLKGSLVLNNSEVTSNVYLDRLPHFFVCPLDFTVGTDVCVDYLVCIKDVLPNIEQGICVSEGKYDKAWIDTQDTFDVFNILFNVMCVKRSVCFVTYITFPIYQIRLIVFSDNHRVGQKHLLNIRERRYQSQDTQTDKQQLHQCTTQNYLRKQISLLSKIITIFHDSRWKSLSKRLNLYANIGRKANSICFLLNCQNKQATFIYGIIDKVVQLYQKIRRYLIQLKQKYLLILSSIFN